MISPVDRKSLMVSQHTVPFNRQFDYVN